jgi:hypothetical protein
MHGNSQYRRLRRMEMSPIHRRNPLDRCDSHARSLCSLWKSAKTTSGDQPNSRQKPKICQCRVNLSFRASAGCTPLPKE